LSLDVSNAHDNGEHGVERREVDTLILTYDRALDHLDIGGHCNSLDLMLDMLARARRVLKSKWKQQELAVMMQRRAQGVEIGQVLADLRKR
jgi:hypothetical protein